MIETPDIKMHCTHTLQYCCICEQDKIVLNARLPSVSSAYMEVEGLGRTVTVATRDL